MWLYFPVPVTPAAEGGVLLRTFLRQCGVSTDLARGIKFQGGGFFADGAPVLANQRVYPGQVVSFELPPEAGGVAPQPEIPLRVAHEDPFALVLDKPAGLAVHPTLNYPGGTLANGYAAWRAARGQSPVFRPVNRIDKDTSGLVLAAQNTYAAPLLAQHVQKLYLAVAEGELPLGPGVIDAPIGRRGDSIIGRCVTPAGRWGHTHFSPSFHEKRACISSGRGLSTVTGSSRRGVSNRNPSSTFCPAGTNKVCFAQWRAWRPIRSRLPP